MEQVRDQGEGEEEPQAKYTALCTAPIIFFGQYHFGPGFST